jgi:hypothetical protein
MRQEPLAREAQMEPTIHVAITRKVKPGFEADFEKALQKFFAQSLQHKGALGAQLIRPIPGSDNRTYGIIRSFAGVEDRDAFYQSDSFREWEAVVQDLVESECSRRDLHGLEAFFFDPGAIQHPPRWKMAIVTWLGVWPTVFILSTLVGPHLAPLNPLAASAIITMLVVVGLTWAVMPALTKLFRPWLRQEPVQGINKGSTA